MREELKGMVDEPQMDIAVLLAMAIRYGAYVDHLVELSGFSREMVERVAKRMTDNGIWVDGKVGFENATDADHFNVEFALHVLVAEGTVVRVESKLAMS
jgi:hypothetical protein